MELKLGQPAIHTRINMAVWHLQSAAKFSRECGLIQQASAGKPYQDSFGNLRRLTCASILMSVAAMESNINEYLEDSNLLFPSLHGDATQQIRELLDRASIDDKYKRLLAFKGKKFDNSGNPYADAMLLIRTRNALVHFRPEWDYQQGTHGKLSKELKYKFEPNPFFGVTDDFEIFPMKMMCHGCSAWAVKTALEFMEEFARLAGIENKFIKSKESGELLG